MQKNAPSQREITAARDELRRQVQNALNKMDETLPRISYSDDDAWRKAHPSPLDRRNAKIALVRQNLTEKLETIIFEARMGTITGEQLFKKVKEFAD